MTNKLDVVGIGNAMVDAMIPSNKEEVEKNNLNRDSMNLIDEDLKNSLHKNYSIKEMIGGSKTKWELQPFSHHIFLKKNSDVVIFNFTNKTAISTKRSNPKH